MEPENRIIRILDANLNRAMEGLRVVEEIARFILADSILQDRIKKLRHEVRSVCTLVFSSTGRFDARMQAIIQSRDSSSDVGAKGLSGNEAVREDLASIIQSNCSRSAESIRVFEEFSKLTGKSGTTKLKKIRFSIYSIEKSLLLLTAGRLNKEKIRNSGLYCIIDQMYLIRNNPGKVAEKMLSGGVKIIQYRDKISCDAPFLKVCINISKICRKEGALFIVNDRVDIALLTDADGVHLGQTDMPVSEARRLLGKGKIIGKSSHSIEEASSALIEDIDYLAVGAMFPTKTKDEIVSGTALLKEVISVAGNTPVVAIGGINLGNISSVLKCRPDGICVISAIQCAGDITGTVRSFIRRIKKGV